MRRSGRGLNDAFSSRSGAQVGERIIDGVVTGTPLAPAYSLGRHHPAIGTVVVVRYGFDDW
jgi:hypothetical protein